MGEQRKRAKSWIAWCGFEGGRPVIINSCDEHVMPGDPDAVEFAVFKKQSDAEKRYRDARRVRITVEPKP